MYLLSHLPAIIIFITLFRLLPGPDACVEWLQRLGFRKFSYVIGESMLFAPWEDAQQMLCNLTAHPDICYGATSSPAVPPGVLFIHEYGYLPALNGYSPIFRAAANYA